MCPAASAGLGTQLQLSTVTLEKKRLISSAYGFKLRSWIKKNKVIPREVEIKE
jgi:hypothetical protein